MNVGCEEEGGSWSGAQCSPEILGRQCCHFLNWGAWGEGEVWGGAEWFNSGHLSEALSCKQEDFE